MNEPIDRQRERTIGIGVERSLRTVERAQRFGLFHAMFGIGFVLGPLVEDNFRRALAISQGDFAIFASSPIALAALGAVVVLLALAGYRSFRNARLA